MHIPKKSLKIKWKFTKNKMAAACFHGNCDNAFWECQSIMEDCTMIAAQRRRALNNRSQHKRIHHPSTMIDRTLMHMILHTKDVVTARKLDIIDPIMKNKWCGPCLYLIGYDLHCRRPSKLCRTEIVDPRCLFKLGTFIFILRHNSLGTILHSKYYNDFVGVDVALW